MSDRRPTDDGEEYPLADMLGELARELDKANERVVQAGHPGRLRWTEATVELGVTWEKMGDGGIDLKVVRLGGSLTKANTTTMTVKVVPTGSAGAPTSATDPIDLRATIVGGPVADIAGTQDLVIDTDEYVPPAPGEPMAGDDVERPTKGPAKSGE